LTTSKRRNVFRVGIAYAITGWLIAQIAGLAAASFFAPDWVMKMIITILLLGFPIAMVMAWAYEMTPEGLRRDAGDEAGQSANTAKLDRTITIALITALAYFAYDKFVLDPERDAALLESVAVQSKEPEVAVEQPAVTAEAQSQSIAVLPFVNMSSDPEQEYFSDGLSEEILNLLSKVRGLKVTARTSSFAFKGKNEDVRYIGKTLNVSTVLEGSVRKSGEQVRITTQLIDVSSGTHLWSDTYDRTLTDIFTVQDNVASEILAALQVHVSTAPTRGRPTENPEAYALLLKAKATLSFGDPFRAETFLNKAIELDP
jgi:TolB-like protein